MSSGSFFAGAFLVSDVVAALSLVSADCTQTGEDPMSVIAKTAAMSVLINFISRTSDEIGFCLT